MFSIPELQQLSPPQYVWDISCVVQIVTGLLFCFVGYRIFKLVLGIVGFAAGAILGTLAGFALGGKPVWAIVGGIAGGIGGAVLLVLLWFVGIFLLGAGLAVMLIGLPLQAVGVGVPRIALLVIGIVGGIVALFLQKLIIVISTAFGGSMNLVTGVTYLLFRGRVTPVNMPAVLGRATLAWMLAAWLLLGIAGIFVQYKLTGKRPWRQSE